MAIDKRVVIGFILFTILTSGVLYLQFENVKIRVDDDKTTFYGLNENNRWVVTGREYSSLFEGATKLNRRVSEINVDYSTDGEMIVITRVTPYIRGPVIRDTYVFNGSVNDVELFPVSHTVEVFNGSGLFYKYEVKDLFYDGETFKLDGDQIYQEFGMMMNVEWWSDYRLGWVYSNGNMYVKSEKMTSDYEVFNVRLYDPVRESSTREDYTVQSKESMNITFEDNRTVFVTDEGDSSFEGGRVNVTRADETIKYDIIFEDNNQRTGWYYTTLKSRNKIEKVGGLSYVVDGVKHTFPMFYNFTNPHNVTYVVEEKDFGVNQFTEEFGGRDDLAFSRINRTHIKFIQTEYDAEPLIRTSLINDNTLLVESKIKVYDPIIDTWDDGNRTISFDYEQGSGSKLVDNAANPNKHDGTLVNSDFGYVDSILPVGSYSGQYNSSTYHDLANSTDLDSMAEFEMSLVLNARNPTASPEQNIVGDDSENFKFITRSGRIIFKTNTDATDCNIDWFEYSSFLTADTNFNLSVVYNGTHCRVEANGEIKRSEASTGIWASNPFSPLTLGGGSGDLSVNGTLDCVNMYIGNTLSDSARSSLFGSCYESGAPVDDPPVVTLNSSDALSFTNTDSFNLNCSATDDQGIVNLSIYHNISGSWNVNQTSVTLNQTYNFSQFDFSNIPNGGYVWNCLAFDNASQSSFASANKTFTISAADSCTYTSGDWIIDCTDNCALSTNTVMDASSTLTASGDGVVIQTANISGWDTANIRGGCDWYCQSGSCLKS